MGRDVKETKKNPKILTVAQTQILIISTTNIGRDVKEKKRIPKILTVAHPQI